MKDPKITTQKLRSHLKSTGPDDLKDELYGALV